MVDLDLDQQVEQRQCLLMQEHCEILKLDEMVGIDEQTDEHESHENDHD